MAEDITEEAVTEVLEAPAPETLTEPELHEYTVNGKAVKEDLGMLKKRAGMGYHYAQQMESLNTERKTFDEQKATHQSDIDLAKTEWGKYKDIDKYAQDNPDWWDSVQQSYQAKQEAVANPEMAELKTQVAELSEFKQNLLNQEKEQTDKHEDLKLTEELKSIRELHKNIDFDKANEEGKSLEYQVLEHAEKTGIPTFTAAFRDFYHEKLVGMAEEGARENLGKEAQRQTKLGMLGQTKMPLKETPAFDHRKYTSNQLLEMAIADSENLTGE